MKASLRHTLDRFMVVLLGVGLWVGALFPSAQAATIHVPAEQPTIQAAINSAVNGDTVLVASGTYVENINFLGKAITVTSEQGPELTIIDGNRSGPVVTFTSGEGATSALTGFTLTNGSGGVQISQSSSPAVTGNRLVNNRVCGALSGAIALYNSSGSPIIQGNVISGNRCDPGQGGQGIVILNSAYSKAQFINNVISDHGARGIYMLTGGSPLVQGNVITGNRDSGIVLDGFSNPLILQNLIIGNGNQLVDGGGIYWFGANGSYILNNTIAGNNGRRGSGILADGYDAQTVLANNIIVAQPGQAAVYCGDFNDLNPPIFKSNNIFAPSGSAYGGICTNQTGLNGNISADPRFVDPSNGYYQLDTGSPSIDAGDNSAPNLPGTDFDGNPRISDGDENGSVVVDMGAYEYYPNPGILQLSSASFSAPENGGSAIITIVRKGGKTGSVSVDFATSDGTATAGSDYVASSGTLTFGDGETEKTFSIPLMNDQTFEGKETVNLRLSNPGGGAVLGARQLAVLNITEPGVLSFASAIISAKENAGCVVVAVHRTDGNSGEVTVHYATVGGTATPGVDYTPTSGTLTFADGETTETFCVPVLNDSVIEGTETIGLLLSDATGGALLNNGSSVLNVSNTDFVSADYFPASPGSTWSYQVNGSGSSNMTVLSAPTVINGVATAAYQDSLGYKEFYTADGNGVRLHGLFMPNVPIQGLGKVNLTLTFSPPVLLANGIADIGQTVVSSGIVSTNKLPRVGVVEFPYSSSFTLVTFDNINVPAGNFDVVRLEGRVEITGQPRSDYVFELADGIGIVRSTTTQLGITETLELVSTNVAPFSINAASLPDGEQNAPYLASIEIRGDSGPYVVDIIKGALPTGLTVDNEGNITGIPSASSKAKSFTVRVSQGGSYVTKAYKINVFKAVSISAGNLKTGTVGKNYSTTLKAKGGKGPFNWFLTSGNLPAGLALNGATGTIAGLPVEKGTFTPTIKVTDALGGAAQKAFTLIVK
jgi:parallel beta-helix repeat protein